MIEGAVSALTAENTLNALDQIDGGEGNDTLKVDLQSNFNGFTKDKGFVKNVENIELTNSGTITRNFDSTGVEGAEKYVLNAGDSSINLSNLAAAGIAVDVVGQKSGTTTIGFTTKAVEGQNDALTLGLNGVGTAAVKNEAGAVTTATKYLAVTATGIENLTVNATGDSFADLSAAATKSVAVTGEGNLDVEKVAAAVTSFDASAAKGNITADLSAATTLATVKGGDGDDNIKVNLGGLTGTAELSGGAGENTLTLTGSGTLQPTMSQFQTVVLDTVTGTLSGKNVSDLSNIKLSGGASTITLAGVESPALNVENIGTASAVTLTSATDLTYTASATATEVATKTAAGAAVTSTITAGEATNATINVGAYANVGGTISVNKANAVTLNVASGKNTATPAAEQTDFAGTINAGAAQAVTVNAEGKLTGAVINAKTASVADITTKAVSSLNLDVEKAQQVNITAGAALNLAGSTFSAAEQVNIVATAGHTSGGVALAKINALNLSGAGNNSHVTVGALGGSDITNAINVTATGLKGGATLGAIDTKGGNVTLAATEVTGNFKVASIGVTEKVGHVTINASTLGSTEVTGAINTVENANVQINAQGLLGKNNDTDKLALKTGAITVASVTSGTNVNNTGSITVNLSGANKFDIGALTAKTVNVDLSGYLGGNVSNTGTPEGKLGTITGQTVTVKGAELGTNAITIDAKKTAAETSATINVTGGLKDDVLTIASIAAITSADAVSITFTGGENTATGDKIAFTTAAVDLTGANSKLTLNGVEVLDNSVAVTVKAADVSGLEMAKTGAGVFTVKGTDTGDTIDLSKLDGTTTVTQFVIEGGKGADTIKLSTLATDKQTVKITSSLDTTAGKTAYSESTTSAYDKISNFTASADKLSISTINASGATAAASKATSNSTETSSAGKISLVINSNGLLTKITEGNSAGSAAVAFDLASKTLAEIVTLIDTADTGALANGGAVTFNHGGNQYVFVQNSAQDVLVELTGLSGTSGIADISNII